MTVTMVMTVTVTTVTTVTTVMTTTVTTARYLPTTVPPTEANRPFSAALCQSPRRRHRHPRVQEPLSTTPPAPAHPDPPHRSASRP